MRVPKKPTGYDLSPSERSVRPASRRRVVQPEQQETVSRREEVPYYGDARNERRTPRRADVYDVYGNPQYDDYAEQPEDRYAGGQSSAWYDRQEPVYERQEPVRERRHVDLYAGRQEDPYEDMYAGRQKQYEEDPYEDPADYYEDGYDDGYADPYEDSYAGGSRGGYDDGESDDYADAGEDAFFELDEEDQILRRGRRRVRAARTRRLVLVLALLTVIVLGLVIYAMRRPGQNKEETEVAERVEVTAVQGSNDTDLEQNINEEAVTWNGEQEEAEEPEEVVEEPQGYFEPSADKDAFFEGYQTRSTGTTQQIVDEEVQSSYAVLINAETGEIVAQRDADTVTSPASMTKIMTLLVAVEHLTDLDETVTMTQEVGDLVYRQGLSAVGYQVGDVIPVRDLLYGTILPSGADAAMLLAQHVAGTEEAFVAMMNDKVAELGLTATCHFANPVGYYDDANQCTMIDMAMILKAAVENDLCRQILNTRIYTTSPTDAHPSGIEISNWFLRRIEDKDAHGEVMCAKTGFVDQSGCCAASYQVSNDGGHYFCVTGNAWSSWRCIYDHVRIYDLYTN